MPNKSFLRKQHFNPKKVDPQFGPPKMYISERERETEREKPCFYATFNIIISHIFPENLIEMSQVVQKIFFFNSNYFY